ncbi:MAG: hypothetical protein FWH10_02385 [Oscillospiraceae bacterium]|nr:hypothetical protein [Oscillospiraceae bacterium]
MRLSKRERVLIFTAAVTVTAYITMQFIIFPMYNLTGVLSEEYDALAMEMRRTEIKLDNEPGIILSRMKAEEKFNIINISYPVNISNEKISGILTELCRESGFNSILSLSVSPQKRPADEDTGAFYEVEVTASLNGDYNSVRNLISVLGQTDNIKISRLSLSVRPESDYEFYSSNISNITVSFEFTVMDFSGFFGV